MSLVAVVLSQLMVLVMDSFLLPTVTSQHLADLVQGPQGALPSKLPEHKFSCSYPRGSVPALRHH